MVRRIWLVLSVLLVCFCPSVALADEVSPLDGLANAVSTWQGETIVPEESSEQLEYEPVLREVETVELRATAEPTAYEKIVSYCNGLRLPWGSTQYLPVNWYMYLQRLFITVIVPAVVGFVFLWWGVRKALKMVMASWRRGRMSA